MKGSPLPFEGVRAFRVIAEKSGLTTAAVASGVTQPAISKRPWELELTLGCPPVRRGVNALGLTKTTERRRALPGRGIWTLARPA